MKVTIVSGGDRVRLRSYVNHSIFAQEFQYGYVLETGPFVGLRSKYYFKIAAMINHLPGSDWLVWMDDDAFVTDFSNDHFGHLLEEAESRKQSFVFANSPVVDGRWTAINSGVFAVRNDPTGMKGLTRSIDVDLEDLRRSWPQEKLGYFSNGDQDALAWTVTSPEFSGSTQIVDFALINDRPRLSGLNMGQPPVVHFAGVRDKDVAIVKVARSLGRDTTLVPREFLAKYGRRAERLPSLRWLEARMRARGVKKFARTVGRRRG